MRLFADYDLLQSDAAPSSVAYHALTRAGVRPEIVYTPATRGRSQLEAATRQTSTPAFVSASGEIIVGARRIAAWARSQAAAAGW